MCHGNRSQKQQEQMRNYGPPCFDGCTKKEIEEFWSERQEEETCRDCGNDLFRLVYVEREYNDGTGCNVVGGYVKICAKCNRREEIL